jgi:hypothetical protein
MFASFCCSLGLGAIGACGFFLNAYSPHGHYPTWVFYSMRTSLWLSALAIAFSIAALFFPKRGKAVAVLIGGYFLLATALGLTHGEPKPIPYTTPPVKIEPEGK